MLEEEMLIEIIRKESDDTILNIADVFPDDIERCPCGSSLVRVVARKVPEGREYNLVCTKCGGHISGIVDPFNVIVTNYKKIIREHTEELLNSHNSHKYLDDERLKRLTKDEKEPKSSKEYWIGYQEGVSFGYEAVIKFIKLLEKIDNIGEKDAEESNS